MLETVKDLLTKRLNLVGARKSAIEKELVELNMELESLMKLLVIYENKQYDSIEEERKVTFGYGYPVQTLIPLNSSRNTNSGIRKGTEEKCKEVMDLFEREVELTITEISHQTGWVLSQVSKIVYILVERNKVEMYRQLGTKKYFKIIGK